MSLVVKWLESMHIDPKVTSACSRKRHLRSTCTACSDVCTNKAISIEGQSVEIIGDRCTSCGDCMITCPLSAIEGISASRELDHGSLLYDGDYTPFVKELLIYKKRGITTVKLEQSAPIEEAWLQAIQEANQQLQLLEEQPIEMLEKQSEETYSRRGLFSSLQKEGKRLAKNLAPAALKIEPNKWNLAGYFPDYQFYTVQLDQERCGLCLACVSYCTASVFTCQEGALRIDKANCVNCSDCRDICPENAITLKQEIKKKEELQYPFLTKKCQTCGSSFLTFHSEKRDCPVCENREPTWLSPYQ